MFRRPARSAGGRRPKATRAWGVAALALVALAVSPKPATAQTPGDAFALRPDVQERLAALQSDWLDWLTAIQGGDTSRADAAAEQLLERVAASGLDRFPELSVAASARAVGFARENRDAEAEEGLRLAESLDPGRPETAFARSAVGRLQGSYLTAVSWWLRGVARTMLLPLTRYVLLSNLLTWVLSVLALGALTYIGVQMATRGQLLYRDLSQALSRSLPVLLAHLLTLAILLWPALLPAGLLWMTFFWSILLWGYGSRGERAVLVLLWVFLGGLPFVVSEQARHMDLTVSRPARAVQSVSEGRLEGQLFSDLQVLADLLPDSVAVKHLMADLHLRLRQWDEARILYREVLAEEPTNTSGLSDLGIAMFYEGNLEGAITVLEDAVARADAEPEAFFNLGRAYAEDLRFDKQAPMTQRASQMADGEVREWLQADVSDEVISVAGGFGRGGEIRRELAQVWRAGEGDPSVIEPWRRALSLPLALVFILPAIALNLLKRRARNRSRRIDTVWAEGEVDVARRVLLPGIPETEEGRTLAGLGSLLLVLAMVTLAARSLVDYSLPLGIDPGLGWLSWLALAALLATFGVRLRAAWLRPRKKD